MLYTTRQTRLSPRPKHENELVVEMPKQKLESCPRLHLNLTFAVERTDSELPCAHLGALFLVAAKAISCAIKQENSLRRREKQC